MPADGSGGSVLADIEPAFQVTPMISIRNFLCSIPNFQLIRLSRFRGRHEMYSISPVCGPNGLFHPIAGRQLSLMAAQSQLAGIRAAAVVQGSVTIAAGVRTATFTITTTPVAVNTTPTITGTYRRKQNYHAND
jgi:hypothetical protein